MNGEWVFFIFQNKVLGWLYVIVAGCTVLGLIGCSIVCAIINHKKRRACEHEPVCTRSRYCCKDCEKIEKEF